MKRNLTLLLILFSLLPFAQGQMIQYGNDWYKQAPNQTYIKLLVAKDGVYRVTAQDLQAAGFDLSTVSADQLQLIYRGQEIRRFISKNSNGSLQYLEFYGRRNDGRVDSLMYRDPISGVHQPDLQPTKELSLFSDTSAYFITWGGSTLGQKYFDYADVLYNMPAETHFRYESRLQFDPNDAAVTSYVIAGGGQYDAFHSLNTDYVTGEGYVSKAGFSYGAPRIYTVPTPGAANTGSDLLIKARVFGRSNTPHDIRIELNNNSTTPVLDTSITFSSIYVKTYERTFNATLSANTDLKFHALRASTDNNNLCWASITYDRNFDLEGGSSVAISDWEKSANAHFRFANADGDDSVFVYDLTDGVRARGLMTGSSTGQVIVPFFSSTGKRQLIFTTDKGIKKPVIQRASLNRLFDPSQGADFVIVTHRSLSSSAEAYRNYRDTARVNPMTARVVYVDEIYDEYGYGSATSWAIKRFCKDALDNWQVKPSYFLFWGKGKYRIREQGNLVPTFGYPASDFEFVGHYDSRSTDVKPFAAVGRVNAFNNQEGLDYLNKVIEYEHTPYESWMKSGVFLGGGATEGEQRAIQNGFEYLTGIFEDLPLGGKAIYYQKTSQGLDDPSSANYHDEISNGVSLIHFFGHSSSNLLDISIFEPFEYTNYDRYPLVIAMGCYGGDFTGGESFGERWVKEPGRGSIGYLANSSAGYLNPLRDYARIYYNVYYRMMFGEPVGEAVAQTVRTYTDSLQGIQVRNHARQMNLQGDPAIRIYSPALPDLELTQAGVFFTPENFTAQDDSFRINIIVNNTGRAVTGTYALRIEQRLPNGESYAHPEVSFPMVKYQDTVSLTLYNPVGNLLAGQNLFDIAVDPDNQIDELHEDNNRVVITLIVPGNIPAILYPAEYAIIDQDRIHLDASAFFMTREENVRYQFEIDTTSEFTSPAKIVSPIISASTNYATWEVPFSLRDSGVYYWRVRLVDARPSIWGSSSFKYISTRTGWAQSQPAQFVKNEAKQVRIDVIQDEWRFNQFHSLFAFSINPDSQINRNYFDFSISGALVTGQIFGDRLLYCMIDHKTLEVVNPPIAYFNLVQNIDNLPNDLYKLKNAIQNTQRGDYFMLAGTGNSKISQWTQDIFDALGQVGVSSAIEDIPDGQPFLLLGRKGFLNAAIEVFSPNSGSKYVINQNLFASLDEASINSTRIGPARSWKEMFWGWRSEDRPPQEFVTVDVFGVRQNGTDTLIYEGVSPTAPFDLSTIDVAHYPYLRLSAEIKDSINYTAPQLDNWHILFDPAPDAVVDPVTNFVFESDTLQEGQEAKIQMGAINVSDYDMDSLLVKFTLVRPDRTQLLLDTLRLGPLRAGNRLDFSYAFDTRGKNLEGEVSLQVEINPDNDQPELYTFNNVYIQSFVVEVDKRNPLLDVTFDGKHIIDGDIVSPSPEILIEVNDENPFVAISDTSAFDVFFKENNGLTPPSSKGDPIYVGSDPRVEFVPAQLPDNRARVRFYPGRNQPLPDGDYALTVQGRDEKGNVSGANDSYFQINFKVVNEASITHVINYPNPFSTSTRFVYTLTGNEIPRKFQIHIYTISGKIVKVIDLLAMGDVGIGRNLSNYAWDGTDEYGDQLANGVYLYRVVTEMGSSEELKLRDEGTSQYFKNGWGKMYLMR